jgi:hypothetical protein
MKTKKNIIFLTENGLSVNVISKLTDNQVKLLIEKFKKSKKEETKEVATKDQKVVTSYKIPNSDLEMGTPIPPELVGKQFELQKTNQGVNAIEVTEDETDDVTSSNALGKDSLQSYTGQESPHDANDMADDGMGDDSGENRSMMGMAESEINEKFQSKSQQGLFWARCNKCSSKDCKWCKMAKEFSDSTSKKDYKKMPKKKNPETNESLQKFLEKKISEMVDNNIDAKMSKKDLIGTVKKKSKSMIIRKPKKVTMFSDEAPMELPIAKMFSIGKK